MARPSLPGMSVTACEHIRAGVPCTREAVYRQVKSPHRRLCFQHSRGPGVGTCRLIAGARTNLNVSADLYEKIHAFAKERMLTIREVTEFILERAMLVHCKGADRDQPTVLEGGP